MRTPSTRLIPVVCLLALAIGACGSATTPSASSAPTSSLVAPLGGQTETEWGLIWDTLPDDFPIVPERRAGRGESAQRPGVREHSWSTVTWPRPSRPGPSRRWSERERCHDHRRAESMDGSDIALEAVRGTDCRVLVTSRRSVVVTSITILYGARVPEPLTEGA